MTKEAAIQELISIRTKTFQCRNIAALRHCFSSYSTFVTSLVTHPQLINLSPQWYLNFGDLKRKIENERADFRDLKMINISDIDTLLSLLDSEEVETI